MYVDAMKLVAQFEGGYVNNPADPGGATNFGITQKVYDNYRVVRSLVKQSVKQIDEAEVADIYRKQYWNEGKCDILDVIDAPIALIHFDACVNLGVFQAAKLLQRAVGVTADGVIGSQTLSRIRIDNKHQMRLAYLAQRMDFYLDLVLAKPQMRQFLPSWMRRIQKITEQISNV